MPMVARMALVALAVLAAAAPAPALAQTPRAERPAYAVGDRWIRTDGVYDLVRMEGQVYVFAAEGGREVRLSRDLGLLRVSRGDQLDWETSPALPIRWPLEVGRWGAAELHWRTHLLPGIPAGAHPAWTDPRTTGMTLRFTWKVDAYEDVETPAGRLPAFRVGVTISDTVESPMRSPTWYLTLWYAPAARQWVRAEGAGELAPLGFAVAALPDRIEPLRVVFAEPADGMRTAAASLPLAATAAGGGGVARLTVSVNGSEVATRGDPRAPLPELSLRAAVPLREGRNVILVTATDAAGRSRQEARTVHRDAPAAAPRPASPLQIAVATPGDQARVEQDRIALAAVISGGSGIRRVVVGLNGAEISRQDLPGPERSVAVNLPLALREGPNTVVITVTEADGSVRQEIRAVEYARAVPLAVHLRFPTEGVRVQQPSSVLAGEVVSGKGVAAVRVTLNGVEVHARRERTPARAVVLSVPLTLHEGVNALVVLAEEADGTVRQEVRTVIYERPAAPPPPAARPAPPPRERWAVVIGVGRYESPAIPRLDYATADAEAVYQVLVGPGGFKKEHVLLLSDRTERRPTLRNLRWAIGTFLARSARKDDTVLIYFAGHGAPEVDPRGLERDGLAKYLVPADADPDDLYATALPMDELANVFARIEAERVVVFLDACYSGAAGGRSFAARRTRAGSVDDLFLERLTRARGRAIITAARPAEVSLELAELGHGLFTYYLVQGLRGAADGNRDGMVTLQELYEYLDAEVSRRARAAGGNQHPVMKGELEGSLPLVRVRGR
jgi:hypothetical protein